MKSANARNLCLLILAGFIMSPKIGNAWSLLEVVGLAEPKDYVNISAHYDANVCPDPEWPVVIEIINDYDQPVTNVAYEVWGHPVGISRSVYASYSGARTDRIIESNDTVSQCIRLLTLWPGAVAYGELHYEDLVWTSKIVSVVVWDE